MRLNYVATAGLAIVDRNDLRAEGLNLHALGFAHGDELGRVTLDTDLGVHCFEPGDRGGSYHFALWPTDEAWRVNQPWLYGYLHVKQGTIQCLSPSSSTGPESIEPGFYELWALQSLLALERFKGMLTAPLDTSACLALAMDLARVPADARPERILRDLGQRAAQLAPAMLKVVLEQQVTPQPTTTKDAMERIFGQQMKSSWLDLDGVFDLDQLKHLVQTEMRRVAAGSYGEGVHAGSLAAANRP